MIPLPPKRRSELRSLAHRLDPTVIIGDKGLTDEVLAEIDRSLKAHELIKVRAATGEREARDAWLEKICERLQAHPVQQIGKVFVIYRENADPPEAQAAARKAVAERGDPRRRPRAGVVSERGKSRQRSRDIDKQREADVKDMVRKGKIKPEDLPSAPEGPSTRTSRPRSRTPSPRPASEPRRRRPRTSR